MLVAEQTVDMLRAATFSELQINLLARKIPVWVENLLKPEYQEETELWVESSEVYLFSNTLLMVIKRPKEDTRTSVSCYLLRMVECCGLIMNGFDEEGEPEISSKGEKIKNGEIELELKIGDKIFNLHSKQTTQKYVKNLISIFNNKIMPNLRSRTQVTSTGS